MMVMLSTLPVWAQAGGNPPQAGAGQQADTAQADEGQMAIPPSVSGQAFPVETGAEERSNYLNVGLLGDLGYVRNVFTGYYTGAKPVNDESYSIVPMVQLDRTNTRIHETFSYSPAFVFFQHTTSLNQATQNARGQADFRLSPHSSISAHDTFVKTDNAFGVPFSLTGGTVSGGSGTPGALAVAPYSDQIANEGGGVYSYQFSKGGMLGMGGGYSELDYPDSKEAVGLYNSNSYSGNAFFNQRLSERQYVGVTGNYFNITEFLPAGSNGQTQTAALLPFYTFYLRKNLFFSLSAGPQYYNSTDPPLKPITGLAPSIVASAHAETQRVTFSLSYQRTVTAGGGLLGAFTANAGSAQIRVLLSHDWSMGASGNYANNKALVPPNAVALENGHMITASAAVMHTLTPHFSTELGYDFLHQSYEGIPVITSSPNSQKYYVTLQYQLRRPLGR